MLRVFCVILIAFGCSTASMAQDRNYEAGQIWAYETVPQDDGSLILIQEVDQIGPDDDPLIVYHISMIGVQVPFQKIPLEIGHLPVSKETLDASVIRLVESDASFPPYAEGKKMWAEANGGLHHHASRNSGFPARIDSFANG